MRLASRVLAFTLLVSAGSACAAALKNVGEFVCRVTDAGLAEKNAGRGSDGQGDSVGEEYRSESGCHPLDERLPID